MAKLDTGEETDTVYTYKSKDKNILRSFFHFSKIGTSNDLAFLKKKILIPRSECHIQHSASQNSAPII